jgi:8-oxo-dGTP pyrophosphatase MutT (NUDIX family)
MSNDGGNVRNLQLVRVTSPAGQRQQSKRFVRLSQLRKLSECEKVAAVCYRVRGSEVEFLLVRTRGGRRWTFPKGSAEPGLTHAQAAAMEAFEEAGVHGRIEESSFARYRAKAAQGRNRSSRSGEKHAAINAFLCEVLRLSPPQESKRERTWFSAEEARRRLREGRENDGGAGIARVLDKALARIEQIRSLDAVDGRAEIHTIQRHRATSKDPLQKDALQKVKFDYVEAYGGAQRMFASDIRRQLSGTRLSAASVLDVHPSEVSSCEILEFSRVREKKSKALGPGAKIG